MKYIKLVFTFLILVFLISCADEKENFEYEEPIEYTIQYTDSLGQHSITVTSGSAYSLESIPEKQGYIFTGLFDAEDGGTQYVNASGSALSVFKDNENLILFPQFKPKEYTVILDYQGAVVTGSRSLNVEYNSTIDSLPMNLQLENKEFMGWYTEPNCKGKQVADQYGVLPANSKVTEKNFNLYDEDGNISLYAGFKGKEYIVTFYASNSSPAEEVKVEHGTPISEVVPTTRINGQAVLTWSKYKNGGEVFNGKVTDNMTLYAVEYAPILEFDTQGGDELTPIVSKSGDTISLPIPTKENYKFIEWQDVNKNSYISKIMPSESIRLYAKWQAMLVFDTRGGTEVNSISEAKGTKITLPTTDKDGYIFAGWFTENGTLYETTSMPEVSILLSAKYYKVLTKKIIVIAEDNKKYNEDTEPTLQSTSCYSKINLEDLYKNGVRDIKITAHYKSKHDDSSIMTYMSWYSSNSVSEAFKVWEYSDNHKGNSGYQSYEQTSSISLVGDTLYVCYYNSSAYAMIIKYGYWTDFWIEVEYPDMSQLY